MSVPENIREECAPGGQEREALIEKVLSEGLMERAGNKPPDGPTVMDIARRIDAALAAREEPRFDQVTIGREEFEQIRRAQGFALFVAALDKPVAVTTRRKMTLERLIEKANDALSGVVGEDTERPDEIERLREGLERARIDAALAAREEQQAAGGSVPLPLLRAAADAIIDLGECGALTAPDALALKAWFDARQQKVRGDLMFRRRDP